MGEGQNRPFQLSFNASLKVDLPGSRETSDGGLILVRELDERLGLEKLIEERLSDSRKGWNEQFTLTGLLQQWVYSRLASYKDLHDAAVSEKLMQQAAAAGVQGSRRAAQSPFGPSRRGKIAWKGSVADKRVYALSGQKDKKEIRDKRLVFFFGNQTAEFLARHVNTLGRLGIGKRWPPPVLAGPGMTAVEYNYPQRLIDHGRI